MQPKIPEENDFLPLYYNYTRHFCLPIHMDDWVS